MEPSQGNTKNCTFADVGVQTVDGELIQRGTRCLKNQFKHYMHHIDGAVTFVDIKKKTKEEKTKFFSILNNSAHMTKTNLTASTWNSLGSDRDFTRNPDSKRQTLRKCDENKPDWRQRWPPGRWPGRWPRRRAARSDRADCRAE